MDILSVTTFCLALLALGRLTTVSFFIVTAIHCTYRGLSTENCENVTSYSQNVINRVNLSGTWMEGVSSSIIVVLIVSWSMYSGTKLVTAAIRVSQFWVWLTLLTLTIIPAVIIMDFKNPNPEVKALGAAIIFEFTTLLVLSTTLHFISWPTVDCWLNARFKNRESFSRFLRLLINVTILAYIIRNVSLFLYTIIIVSKKILRVSASDEEYRSMDFMLQVMNAAFRGSLSQFYFAQMFQNTSIPNVCDNVPILYDYKEFLGQTRRTPAHLGLWDKDGKYHAILPYKADGVLCKAGSFLGGYDSRYVEYKKVKGEKSVHK